MLNCLFAALNKQSGRDKDVDDDVPYSGVPDFIHLNTMTNSTSFHFQSNPNNIQKRIANSYTQDDLRVPPIATSHSQTPTPPSQISGLGSGSSGVQISVSGSGSSAGGYYMNESLSESSGDSLSNHNNITNGNARPKNRYQPNNRLKISKSANFVASCEVYAKFWMRQTPLSIVESMMFTFQLNTKHTTPDKKG